MRARELEPGTDEEELVIVSILGASDCSFDRIKVRNGPPSSLPQTTILNLLPLPSSPLNSTRAILGTFLNYVKDRQKLRGQESWFQLELYFTPPNTLCIIHHPEPLHLTRYHRRIFCVFVLHAIRLSPFGLPARAPSAQHGHAQRRYRISAKNRQYQERRGRHCTGESEVERVAEEQGYTRPRRLTRDWIQPRQAVCQRTGHGDHRSVEFYGWAFLFIHPCG